MPLAPESMRGPRLRLRQALGLLFAAVVIAVVLGELYALAAGYLSPAWLAALVVNAGLGAGVLLWQLTHGGQRLFWPPAVRWFGPAAAVLLLCAAAACGSRFWLAPTAATVDPNLAPVPWAWLVLVPIAEELVFRAGIGQGLRLLAPRLWAAWFSAVVFALVHTQPTLAHLWAGQVGLALGPFLLGIACEMLLAASGSLWPAVLLHAACNATVLLFQQVDARWLDWLTFLYG